MCSILKQIKKTVIHFLVLTYFQFNDLNTMMLLCSKWGWNLIEKWNYHQFVICFSHQKHTRSIKLKVYFCLICLILISVVHYSTNLNSLMLDWKVISNKKWWRLIISTIFPNRTRLEWSISNLKNNKVNIKLEKHFCVERLLLGRVLRIFDFHVIIRKKQMFLRC